RACCLVLVGQGDVHIRGPRAAGDQLLGFAELGVDHFRELVERLRAADRHAIDAERGRAIGADLVAIAMSSSIFAENFLEASASLNFALSTPASPAHFSKFSA